jgi:hypothetical protein
MVGLEQMIWQNPMHSQGLSHNCRNRKYMGLYGIEHDQEKGVISDLAKIICQRKEKEKSLHTQKKVSVAELRFCNWEKVRSARHDGRKVISYPKICNLFFSQCLEQ